MNLIGGKNEFKDSWTQRYLQRTSETWKQHDFKALETELN